MAKVFLESTDSDYKVSNSGVKVFGATGTQAITLGSDVTGVTVNSLVDQVNLANLADYRISQEGTNLVVKNTSDAVVTTIGTSELASKLHFTDTGDTALNISPYNNTSTMKIALPSLVNAAADLKALDAAFGIVLDTTATTAISGAAADVKALVDSANADSVGIILKDDVAVTVSDAADTELTATTLSSIGAATTGDVTVTNAVKIAGTAAEVETALVDVANSGASLVKAETALVTISDAADTELTATTLSSIGAATTGDVTVTNAVAITGAIADVTAATVTAESKVILDDATITISDADATAIGAADLKAIGAATTGDVTVTNAVAIIGSASDVTAATVTPESKVILDDATITISDETTKAVFDDIDAATTGTITATITTGDDDTDVSVVYTQVNVLTITNFEAGATDTININALTNGGDILGTDFTTYDGTKTAEDDHIVNLAQDSAIAKADDVVALFEGNGGTSDSKMLLDTDDTTFLVVQDNDASAGDDFDAQLWLVDNDDGTIAATLIGTVYDANDSESLAFNDFA